MKDVIGIYGTNPDMMVAKLLDKLNPVARIPARAHVVIKPNIVVSRASYTGVNTNPAVIEQIVRYLKDHGIDRITIADGSGMGHSATRAFPLCGYDKMAKTYGLSLVDLEKDSFERRRPSIRGPFSSLEIAKTAAECGYLINVPLMKAHRETNITCSLKNMKGLMPRGMKTAFHGRDLDTAIAQLNSVIIPDVTVVDGTYGDLSSELGSNPVEIGMMFAGYDPVAVDCVVAQVLGFSPWDIRHIAKSLPLRKIDPARVTVEYLNTPEKDMNLSVDTRYKERYPCEITDEGVCCTCRSNLLFALERLQSMRKLSNSQHFVIGQKGDVSKRDGKHIIAVGKCAAKRVTADIAIPGCPAVGNDIVKVLQKW